MKLMLQRVSQRALFLLKAVVPVKRTLSKSATKYEKLKVNQQSSRKAWDFLKGVALGEGILLPDVARLVRGSSCRVKLLARGTLAGYSTPFERILLLGVVPS